MADALDADLQAGGVHHHEHVGQALAQLADQLGLGALVQHHAGGRAVDAQLVLDGPPGRRSLAAAQRAVVVHHRTWWPGTGEMPFTPGGASGSAGQDQVADVVGARRGRPR